MGFKFDISKALKGMADAELKTRAAVGVYADTAGKKLEAHAKKNAPWTDRTGQARQTIRGGKEWNGDRCDIYVSGNTDYFQYLEFAHEKRYAILYPTINELSNEIISGTKKLLK